MSDNFISLQDISLQDISFQDTSGARLRVDRAMLQRRVEELEKALRALIGRAEGEACYHQKRHRGGTIWEICDDCGEKWADDRGGFKKHKEWKEITASRIALNSTKEAK